MCVILREELAFCLLEWAGGEWGWQDPASPATAKASAVSANAVATSVAGLERQKALAEALKQRGIEDPAATLRAGTSLQAMENERAHPEQSVQVWRSQALAQVAPSEFVASLYQSFDTAMARATASFGTEAQVWVSAVAIVLVLILQLDTVALVRRLSVDETYRQTLVGKRNGWTRFRRRNRRPRRHRLRCQRRLMGHLYRCRQRGRRNPVRSLQTPPRCQTRRPMILARILRRTSNSRSARSIDRRPCSIRRRSPPRRTRSSTSRGSPASS